MVTVQSVGQLKYIHFDLCCFREINEAALIASHKRRGVTSLVTGCSFSLRLERVLWTQQLMSNHRLHHLLLLALQVVWLMGLLLG